VTAGLKMSEVEKDPLPSKEVLKVAMKDKRYQRDVCIMQQSMGAVIGGGMGIATFAATKNIRPFFILATTGLVADYAYGYMGPCSSLVEEYNLTVEAYKNCEN
jgi:hypothetical protein